MRPAWRGRTARVGGRITGGAMRLTAEEEGFPIRTAQRFCMPGGRLVAAAMSEGWEAESDDGGNDWARLTGGRVEDVGGKLADWGGRSWGSAGAAKAAVFLTAAAVEQGSDGGPWADRAASA